MTRNERLFNAIVVMGAAMTGCGGSKKPPDPVQNTVSPMQANVADAGVDATETKPKEVILIL